ncbi:MAG: ABC transporter permease [Coriobacteriales bacterium]|jgi:NitT/TauT family transport system permease protein|nr:ABC transporter permease [Coriobacteriales bacterium]
MMMTTTIAGRLKRFGLGASGILAFFALWQLVTMTQLIPRSLVPPPTKVFEVFFTNLVEGKLTDPTLFSLSNVALGLALAIAVGITLGFVVGLYLRRSERVFLPFFRICEKLNPFALFPIFIILFGIARLEKVMVVFWVSLWPLLFATVDGAHNLERPLLKSARSMGAKRGKLLFKVILPLMLPSIFSGLKLSATLAFFMIIASEMVGANNGLGWLYLVANHAYNLPLMYGIILFITLLAILINVLFSFIERRFQLWKPSASFE